MACPERGAGRSGHRRAPLMLLLAVLLLAPLLLARSASAVTFVIEHGKEECVEEELKDEHFSVRRGGARRRSWGVKRKLKTC